MTAEEKKYQQALSDLDCLGIVSNLIHDIVNESNNLSSKDLTNTIHTSLYKLDSYINVLIQDKLQIVDKYKKKLAAEDL